MFPSSTVTVVGAIALTPFLAFVEVPSSWMQLGLGGLALMILYRVLRPLVQAQVDASRAQIASNERMATALTKIALVLDDVKGTVERLEARDD